jgi:hypothetical protein
MTNSFLFVPGGILLKTGGEVRLSGNNHTIGLNDEQVECVDVSIDEI